MMRWFNLVLLGLVVAAATWTYQVKHEAEVKLEEIRKLEKQIALEKDTIELLKADWAYLSHPSRVQALVERYKDELGLEVTGANQIIEPSELPGVPAVSPNDLIGDVIAGDDIMLKDDVITSSIDGGEGN